MKRMLALLSLSPALAFGQQLQSDHTDDFGKVRRLATSRIEFDGFATSLGGTLTVGAHDTALYLHLMFQPRKATTVNTQTTATLLLDNNEQVILKNSGGFRKLQQNESGALLFQLSLAEKAILTDHKVVRYRIVTVGATVDVVLQDNMQTAFAKTIGLLEASAAAPWPCEGSE